MPSGQEARHSPEGGQVLGISHGGVQAAGEGHVDVKAHAWPCAHLREAETHTSQALGQPAPAPRTRVGCAPHSWVTRPHGPKRRQQGGPTELRGPPARPPNLWERWEAAPSLSPGRSRSSVLSDRHRPLFQLPSWKGDLGGRAVSLGGSPHRGASAQSVVGLAGLGVS